MKKIIVYASKCCIAAVISIVLLSLFSMLYYNPPIAVQQPDCTTNYKYVPNKTWSYMTEGFGYGKTDNLGYNNAYYPNLTDPDIVVAGSSHMEALEVPQDKNCVYLLNEMFDIDNISDNDYKCLNLGVSGHSFEVTASNYQFIANKFHGARYILIECFDMVFSSQVLDDIIAEKYRYSIEKKSFVDETVQNIPFLRALYKKIKSIPAVQATPEEMVDSTAPEYDLDVYTDKMNVIIGKIVKISAENNVEPIILMHERFWKDENGNIVFELDESYKNAFKKCCENNGVRVIDVSPEMASVYKDNFEFSYGFANSAPEEGHLNITGHRIIAESVYKYINEMEEQK